MTVHVIIPLGIELHDLTEGQVLGLLSGDPHPDHIVGLDFARDGYTQPAALIFTESPDQAGAAGRAAQALAASVGLTPGVVEVLTPDEYESRALDEAATGDEQEA